MGPKNCVECGEDVTPCCCDLEWARTHFHPSKEVVEIGGRADAGGIELPVPTGEAARRLFGCEYEDALSLRLELLTDDVDTGLAGAVVSRVTKAGLVLSVEPEGYGYVDGHPAGLDVLIPWPTVRRVSLAYSR